MYGFAAIPNSQPLRQGLQEEVLFLTGVVEVRLEEAGGEDYALPASSRPSLFAPTIDFHYRYNLHRYNAGKASLLRFLFYLHGHSLGLSSCTRGEKWEGLREGKGEGKGAGMDRAGVGAELDAPFATLAALLVALFFAFDGALYAPPLVL